MQTAIQWYEIIGEARVKVRPDDAPRPDDSGRRLGPPVARRWRDRMIFLERVAYLLPGENGWYGCKDPPWPEHIRQEMNGLPGWVCEDPDVSQRGHPGYSSGSLWRIFE